jgi:hypothetical protein
MFSDMERSPLSASDVIDALGGTKATAKIAHRTPQAVSNWRKENRLPPQTFLVLSKKLHSAGLDAPPSLWGIEQPEQS